MTPEQQRAIQSNERRILVKAGAGTGKTEVLTRRIVRLVDENPELSVLDLAVITFTNKATEEMLSRLKDQFFKLWKETNDDVEKKERLRYELELLSLAQVTTIHRFCRSILDLRGPFKFGETVYAPGFNVSETGLHKAIDLVLNEWLMEEEGGKPLTDFIPVYQIRKELLDLYKSIRSKGYSWELILEKNDFSTYVYERTGYNQKIRQVLSKLLKNMAKEHQRRKIHELDPDDLLGYTRRLLEDDADFRNRVREKYKHIFVDEFQDTSSHQTKILQLLCSEPGGPSLFAVGDRKQSIYQFRGADLDSYGEMEQWIQKKGIILSLTKNFRSVQPIVEYVNDLFREMEYNPDKPQFVAEDLTPYRLNDQERKKVIQWIPPGERGPIEGLAYFLNEMKKQSVSLHRYTILFRTNRSLLEYENRLTEQGIKTQVVGGGHFFQKREIVDLYRILNYLVSPGDPIKVREAMESEYIQGNPEILEKLREETRPIIETYTVAQLLEKIYDSDTLSIRKFYGGRGRVQALFNLDRLKEITRDTFRGEQIQLVGFVDWLSINIRTNFEEKQAETFTKLENAVQLITIHSAKGLQFPNIILPELDRNLESRRLMPSLLCSPETGIEFSLEKHNQRGVFLRSSHYVEALERYKKEYLEEEARILYVALTRAQERIYFLGNPDSVQRKESFGKWLIAN